MHPWLVLAWMASLFVVACDQNGAQSGPSPEEINCATPNAGCPCSAEGQAVACGTVEHAEDGSLWCSTGHRVCATGEWGQCAVERTAVRRLTPPGGMKTRGLAPNPSSCLNPCDPYCQQYDDDAEGFDAGACESIVATDAGLTLLPNPQGDAGSLCNGLAISPTISTVIVNGINGTAVSASPANIQFTASAMPAGCMPSPLSAVWTLDKYNVGTIDGNGLFTAQAAVAGPVQVTAYVGGWQASATINVRVDIETVEGVPASTANVFTTTPTGTDPLTILYPYAETVFPPGLLPPFIQWSNNGTAANAVKVSLRYPATGSPVFEWSKVRVETNPPRAGTLAIINAGSAAERGEIQNDIPASVWNALAQTAKGQQVALGVQRVVGGVLKPETSRTVQFGDDLLRGRIYYTEYQRYNNNNQHAYIRKLDPASSAMPANAFPTDTGCPVCHSVAANGSMFITSNRTWSNTSAGVSRIDPDGTFTHVSDQPVNNPFGSGVDWRGFAWAGVTPDGRYALQANNHWGNTEQGTPTYSMVAAGRNGNGLTGRYYPNRTLTGSATFTREDGPVDFPWGNSGPGNGVGPDNFSVSWTGTVQAMTTEVYTFYTSTDDGVRLWVNNQLLIDRWIDQGTTEYSGSISLVAGQRYPIKMEYYENGGGANAQLSWSSPSFAKAFIPRTQLFSDGWTAPCTGSSGLTGTYYDDLNYLGQTQYRCDSTVNFSWGTGAPTTGILADTFTALWTGQVNPPCDGTYTFTTTTDDGVRLWVNRSLIIDHWVNQGPTPYSATINLVGGVPVDIALEYFENTGGATAQLAWSGPCVTSGIIQSAYLTPTGDSQVPNAQISGPRDYGTGVNYRVYAISSTPGTSPSWDVNGGGNNWGLGSTVMMVPTFSPDGTKLVFVDGDSSAGAGWRKGLSLFDFNDAAKSFSNRRNIHNAWPNGDVVKWPTFESDSRSIIFQTSTPTETCNTCSTKYGHMAPTNYFQVPGRLWSIDGDDPVNHPAVELARLNIGERPEDANKAYQPTMLPVASGSHRYVVFTSTRPFGNSLNDPGTTVGCLQSHLWVAAIDNTVSAETDRSHPAFWLPSQLIGPSCSNRYINERAYWVLEPCKPPGTGDESRCTVNDDCCGASDTPPTAVCAIDLPLSTPITRHCKSLSGVQCALLGGPCGSDTDCCDFPSAVCGSGVCQVPPPVNTYSPAEFDRIYEGICDVPGTHVEWLPFEVLAVTPSDSKLRFSIRTSEVDGGFSGPKVPLGVVQNQAVPDWVTFDLPGTLEAAGMLPLRFLEMTIGFEPSSDGTYAPVMIDWRQSYTCPPTE